MRFGWALGGVALIAWSVFGTGAPLQAADPEVTAPPVPRVATLVPSALDALRVAGVPVVAAARRLSFEPPPAGIVDLGISHSPDFERLAQARPDLVVADRRWHAAMGPKIAALGAEIFWFEAESVEATLGDLQRLGDRLGRGEALRVEIDRVRQSLASERLPNQPRVLAVFGAPGSFFAITRNTWIGDLLLRQGAALAEPSKPVDRMPGYAALSDEFLVAVPVDAVLLLAHGEPQAVAAAFATDWRRLRGEDTPVHVLDAGLFAVNPGLRLPEAAAAVRLALAPADGVR